MISFSSDSPFANRILINEIHPSRGRFRVILDTSLFPFLLIILTFILTVSHPALYRQEGIKELKNHLGSRDFLQYLDRRTNDFTAQVEDVSLRHTWSGIVSSVVAYVNAEIESHRGKNKVCDKNITSILREVVKTAEERKKVAGVQLPLLKRAKKIFEHVVDVLEEAGSEFTTDYSHLLRMHLLMVPEYCTKLQADVFEGLCEFFVQQIEQKRSDEGYGSMDSDDLDTGVITKEDMYKSASTLVQLLKSYPSDITSEYALRLLKFFATNLKTLKEDTKLPASLMLGLNLVLARNGIDCQSNSKEIHEDVAHFLHWAFKAKNARDKKLRDNLVTYSRIQLKLGGLEDEKALRELAVTLEKEIESSYLQMQQGNTTSYERGGDYDHEFRVKAAHWSMCELLADVLAVHSRLRKDVLVDLDDNTIVNHDSKRAKTMNISPTSVSISTLISRICGEHSKEWGPVVCAFLCNSGTDELIFPDTTLRNWASLLNQKFRTIYAVSGTDAHARGHILWLTRALEQLAIVMRFRNEDNSKTLAISTTDKALWTEARDFACKWLPALATDNAISSASLRLISAMTVADLVATPVSSEFWKLHPFDMEQPPTIAALETIASMNPEHSFVLFGKFSSDRNATMNVANRFRWILSLLDSTPRDKMVFYRKRNPVIENELMLKKLETIVRTIRTVTSMGSKVETIDTKDWIGGADEEQVQVQREIRNLDFISNLFSRFKQTMAEDTYCSTSNNNQTISDLALKPKASEIPSTVATTVMCDALVTVFRNGLEDDDISSEEAFQLAAVALEINSLYLCDAQKVTPGEKQWRESSHSVISAVSNAISRHAGLLIDSVTALSSSEKTNGCCSVLDRLPSLFNAIANLQKIEPKLVGENSRLSQSIQCLGSAITESVRVSVDRVKTTWEQSSKRMRNYRDLPKEAPGRHGGLSQSQRATGQNKNTQELFDDELDEGLPREKTTQTSQSYNNTTSNVFSQRAESTISSFERMVIAGVNALRAYSKIDANAAAEKVTSILQLAVPPNGVIPRGVTGVGVPAECTLEVICELIGPGVPFAIEITIEALEALQRLSENSKLSAGMPLSARKWILRRIETFVNQFLRSQRFHDQKSSSTAESLGSEYFPRIIELVQKIIGIDPNKMKDGICDLVELSQVDCRVQLTYTIESLHRLSVDAFQPAFGDVLCVLVEDDSFKVRCSAGFALAATLSQYDNADVLDIFRERILPQFRIACPAPGSSEKIEAGPYLAEPAEETTPEIEASALYAIAAMGIASDVIEPWSVFMICAHGAVRDAKQRAIAVKAIDELMEYSGAANRKSYIRRHSRSISYLWAMASLPLDKLFDNPDLFAIDSGKCGSTKFLPGSSQMSSETESSIRKIAHLWASMLLPALILKCDAEGVTKVAKGCGYSDDGTYLIKQHFSTIIARIYPGAYSNPPEKRCVKAFKSEALLRGFNYEEEVMLSEMSDRLGDIVKEMLDTVDEPTSEESGIGNVAPGYVFPCVIIEAIKRIATQAGKDWDIWGNDRPLRCLANLHYSLDHAPSSRLRKQTFAGVKTLIEALSTNIISPPTMRYFIHVLMPYVEDEVLGVECVQLLKIILVDVLQSPEVQDQDTAESVKKAQNRAIMSNMTFLEQLQPLMCTLLDAARNMQASAAAAAALVADLLRFCFLDKKPRAYRFQSNDKSTFNVLQAMEYVSPISHEDLKKNPLLKQATKLLPETGSRKPDKNGLKYYLAFLIQSSNGLPPVARTQTLLSGGRAIINDPDLIVNVQKVQKAEQGEQKNMIQDELRRDMKFNQADSLEGLAWQFAEHADSVGDEELLTVAAQILGMFGPLNPNISAFFSPTDRHVKQMMDKDFDESKLAGEALTMISDLTCSHNSDTVISSMRTARLMLGSKAALEALKGLDSMTNEYLRPFVQQTQKGALAAQDKYDREIDEALCKENSGQMFLLDSPALWSPANRYQESPKSGAEMKKRHGEWICRLVSTLILHCKSPFLKLCRITAFKNAELAELIFPAVLADIAENHPERKDARSAEEAQNHRLISIGVSRCFEDAADMNGKRACQTMLKALDSMRARRARALVTLDAGGGSRKSMGSKKSSKGTPPERWTHAYWVNVDYLDAADAAITVGAPFTATLLVEAWLEHTRQTVKLDQHESVDKKDSINGVPRHLRILIEAQECLNEPDGMHGLNRTNALQLQLRMSEHEGSWEQVLAGHDLNCRINAASSRNNNEQRAQKGDNSEYVKSQARIMKSLRRLGCLHTLDLYAKSLSSDVETIRPELAEAQFEAAWRSGQWDLSSEFLQGEITNNEATKDGHNDNESSCDSALFSLTLDGKFHKDVHSSLRALSSGDLQVAFSLVQAAGSRLVRSSVAECPESADTMNRTIIRLRSLHDIFNSLVLCNNVKQDPQLLDEQLKCLEEEWSRTLLVNYSSLGGKTNMENTTPYSISEPLLAVRGTILRAFGYKEALAKQLILTATIARKAGAFDEALQAVRELRLVAETTPRPSDAKMCGNSVLHSSLADWKVEEAKLFWAKGRKTAAIALAKSLIEGYSPKIKLARLQNEVCDEEGHVAYFPPAMNSAPDSFFEILTLLSKWQHQTRSESSNQVYAQMFSAVRGMTKNVTTSKVKNNRKVAKAYFRLATFAYSQYKSIDTRLKSTEWQKQEELKRLNEEEYLRLEHQLRTTRNDVALRSSNKAKWEQQVRELARKVQPLHTQVTKDCEESTRLALILDNWLVLTIQNYRRSLNCGVFYARRAVFRIFELWINNCGGMTDRTRDYSDDVATILNSEIRKVIDTVLTHNWLELTHQIVSRLGVDGVDETYMQNMTDLVMKMASDHPYHVLYHVFAQMRSSAIDDRKAIVAKEIIERIRNKDGKFRHIIEQMEQMIEAYILLAQNRIDKTKSRNPYPIPSQVKKRALSNLDLLPILTADVPVDFECEYNLAHSGIATFRHFGENCRLVGGINQPKLVECYGSDGNVYKQLAKSGNDDLRQDAVMQQYFKLTNSLLKTTQSARKLRVKTYKVIPFTPEAGLLEWVDDTMTLASYLVSGEGGVRSAHERYRPNDLRSDKCREMMMQAISSNSLRMTYDEICDKFKPVMHHLFLENFALPAQWHAARLQYTRSVAVNSMVGYIIGLGDRHNSNILIDNKTAEVVHIDLGIAFEQGLYLKTPERVPFRLTRDLVDAMGACGVEGVMRRCCEETMKVLRANKDALTTIIAVLVHDPIVKWAVSSKRQRTGISVEEADNGLAAQTGNLDAERALLRVTQKLDGYEEGEILSVEGQVQQLLHDAQDEENLSKMYHGWAAWV